jgi:hypothetical protein
MLTVELSGFQHRGPQRLGCNRLALVLGALTIEVRLFTTQSGLRYGAASRSVG